MSEDLNDELAQVTTAMFVQQGVNAIRQQIHRDQPSKALCDCCGAAIPLARQQAVPGVELCAGCQDVSEKRSKHHSVTGNRGGRYV